MKALLQRVLPRTAYEGLRRRWRAVRDGGALCGAALYDLRRFARGSGLLRRPDRGVLQARLLKAAHRLEKGLALPSPQPGHGADAVASLLDDLPAYRALGPSDWVVETALRALQAHVDFNRAGGQPMPAAERRLADLWGELKSSAAADGTPGGTRPVRRDDVLAASALPFDAFVRTRHSVRQFAARAVDDELISQAVADARHAPSVCNRGAGRVYVVDDPARARELLAFQDGNRGFGETAGRVLVVAVRPDAFLTVGERHQGWIDGGLFGMTLVYALHARGLGTCCLNWSVRPAVDRAFKRAAGIPLDEGIVMLLAVGHLPDELVVACSPRRPLAEVLHRIGARADAPRR